MNGINTIPTVCAAPSGVLTHLDLPFVAPTGLVCPRTPAFGEPVGTLRQERKAENGSGNEEWSRGWLGSPGKRISNRSSSAMDDPAGRALWKSGDDSDVRPPGEEPPCVPMRGTPAARNGKEYSP